MMRFSRCLDDLRNVLLETRVLRDLPIMAGQEQQSVLTWVFPGLQVLTADNVHYVK
jgi:hypothetical protein